MGNEDVKRLQRAEVVSRLATLDLIIEEQRGRIAEGRSNGWDTTVSETRLRLLLEARRLHCVAFAAAYGKSVLDEEGGD